MPFNGVGVYSLPAGNPVVTGTTVSSTTHNNTNTDIASALTNTLTKDGQSTPTANIPMGTFRLTNLGSGVSLTDSVTLGQYQSGAALSLSSVAGVDTITATATPVPSAYALGQVFRFISVGANTGAVTINISGLGAKAIVQNGVALTAGDIPTLTGIEIIYDGTQFNILSTTQGKVNKTSLTGSAQLPVGTTAQRDVAPTDGYVRFNSTLTALEAWYSAAWNTIATTASAVLIAGDQTIAGVKTFSAGPIVPTAAVNTNTTQIASTAFVVAQIADDAPTKTGGNASGSWGISVTGSSASCTGNAATAGSCTGSAALNVLNDTGAGGVGSIQFVKTGTTTASGATVAGSSLRGFTIEPTTPFMQVGAAAYSGTWRNVGSGSVTAGEIGNFQRIS